MKIDLQKKSILISLGLILLLSLGLSYGRFLTASRNLDYQAFNFKDTYSWREAKKDIYRIASKGNIDTLLLSKDRWRDFEASFNVINPRDCGFIYNYTDERNFDFVLFDGANQRILFGQNRQGASSVVKKSSVANIPVLPIRIKTEKGNLNLFIQDQLLASLSDAVAAGGKIGLMLKNVGAPPTLFHQVTIKGHTDRGVYVSTEVGDQRMKKLENYGFSVVMLYLLMIALSIYLAYAYHQYQQGGIVRETEEKEQGRLWTALLVHLALAVFIFWPYFSRGEILVSSGDNFGEIYPLFIFSKHNFHNILSGQSLSLWNPYSHNGIPFFSNHWNMIFYPLNWPLFFLSDKTVLGALTFRMFLEVFLLGALAYQFFVIELKSRRWALFCSVIYQLCSLLIFTFSIFPAISLYFAMTLYLYSLWSMGSRKAIWNFLLLSFSIILFLTSANMAFIFYAGMSLIVFTIYRLMSLDQTWKERVRDLSVLGWSALCGILISAIRILPCIFGVMDSNRLVENYYTIHDRFAMLTRLFLPEIVGWLGPDSLNALTSRNLNLIFERIDLPSNSQNTFLVYFGILAGLLLLLNILIKTEGKHLFWKTYSLVAIGLGLMIQPLWGIFNILLFPFNHYSYYIIILPVGICTLLGYTAKYLEREECQPEKLSSKFFMIVLLVQAFLLVFLTYLFPQITPSIKIIIIGMVVWYVAYRYLNNYYHELKASYLYESSLCLLGIASFVWFMTSTIVLIKPIPKKEMVMPQVIMPVLLIFIILLLAMYIYMNFFTKKATKTTYAVPASIGLVVLIAAGWLARSPLLVETLALEDRLRNYIIDVLFGGTKFLLVLLLAVFSVVIYKKRWLPIQGLVCLFILISTLDLLAFNARFDNVVAPTPHKKAFYPSVYPYRDLNENVKKNLDLINYRAHYLHRAGLNANKNLIYNVPSYSGIMGHMPKRFHNLVHSFGYPKETVLIYPIEANDDNRFLDLSAVRYTFTGLTDVQERTTALPRLSLYYSYEVIEDDGAHLDRLKDSSFNPAQTVLLFEEPLLSAPLTGRTQKVNILDDSVRDGDQVRASIKSASPALLLFNETYSNGWKAYIDNRQVPVYPANYTFMAVPVEAGEHEVVLKYRPKLYSAAVAVYAIGLVLFIGGCAVLIFFKEKFD